MAIFSFPTHITFSYAAIQIAYWRRHFRVNNMIAKSVAARL